MSSEGGFTKGFFFFTSSGSTKKEVNAKNEIK